MKIKIALTLLLFVSLLTTGYTETKKKKETTESLKLSLETAKKEAKAEILIKIAKQLNRKKKLDESLPYIQQAIKLSEELAQHENEVKAISELTSYYWDKNDDDKAVENCYRHIETARKYNLKKHECDGLYYLSWTYNQLKKDHSKALKYAKECLKLATSIKDNKKIINSYAAIGDVYFEMPKYKKAAEYFQKMADLYQKMGDKPGTSLWTHSVGTAYLYANHLKKAKEYWLKAIELYKRDKNHGRVLQLLSYIGSYYREFEQHEKALEVMDEGDRYYQSLPEKNKSTELAYGRIINRRGQLYFRMKKHQKAIETTKMLEAHGKKHKEGWLLLLAQEQLAKIYIDLKQFNTAKHYLQQGLDNKYGLEFRDYRERYNTDFNILFAKIYYLTKAYPKALETLKGVLETAIKFKKMKVIIKAYQLKGKIHTAQNNFDDAMKSIHKSIEYNEKYNNNLMVPYNKDLKENYILLSKLYLKKGNKTKAEKYQKLYENTVENPNKI